MDKILLTRDERLMLRDWYDKNASLVEKFPCPLKNIQIEGILKDFSAKFFRDGNNLKIYIAEDGEKSFRVDLVTDNSNGNIIVEKEQFLPISGTAFELILTHYFAAMAFITYAGEVIEVSDNSSEHKTNIKSKNKNLKKNKGVTYILRLKKVKNVCNKKGTHASPKGIFTVRGHFRHYKSGKEVWIEQFQKGTGDKKHKIYKLQKETA